MSNKTGANDRQSVTYIILGGSLLIIIFLTIFILVSGASDSKMDYVHIIIPVIATWVGAILAFYYGKQNFDAANEQVRKIVEKLTPEQLAEKPVTTIMRALRDMAYFSVPKDRGEKDVKISELTKLTDRVSRLPILDAGYIPKYMIHESTINKYLVQNPGSDGSLQELIQSFKCGLDNGFVIVSENTSIGAAKKRMEEIPSCQDTFITKSGKAEEPLSGWISNIRLEKFLRV